MLTPTLRRLGLVVGLAAVAHLALLLGERAVLARLWSGHSPQYHRGFFR